MQAVKNQEKDFIFDSQWSEVNSLVYTLSNSSCPRKTIEKWFPKCKRHKNTHTTADNNVFLDRIGRQRSCSRDNNEKASLHSSPLNTNVSRKMQKRKYESTANALLNRRIQQFDGKWKGETERRSTFVHNKQRHQRLQKALLVQNEVKFCSESPYNYLFIEVSHNKEANNENHPDRTTPSVQEMSKFLNFFRKGRFNTFIEISFLFDLVFIHLKYIASIRKKIRTDNKERFKAGCSERLSALRIQAVKQRYELHLAEVRRREIRAQRLMTMQQNNEVKRKTNPSSNDLSKLIRAMETGMLLISDESEPIINEQ